MNGMVRLGSGSRRPLDVGTLERDLSGLWKEARGEEARVMRACHATLVVAAGDDDARTRDFLDELTALHPSRILVVRESGSRPPKQVEAWVSASCSRRPGDVLICGETVHLEAGPESDRILASVIRSLRVGDLPAAAVVRERSPLVPGWVGEVESELDLVVGDSEALVPPAAARLWSRCGMDTRPAGHDLAWSRLLPWRRAVASLFDAEEGRSRLDALAGIEVEGKGEGDPRALLLAAWLAGGLGEVLVGRPRPGSDLSVGLRFGEESTVFRPGPSGSGIVRDPGGERVSPGQAISDARAVVEEIRRPAPDPAFRKAARRAAAWGVGS